MANSIVMDTKGGGSIALVSCNEKEYLKETYSESDGYGVLKKSKRVQLPVSRDGTVFHDVASLFSSLIRDGSYLPLA